MKRWSIVFLSLAASLPVAITASGDKAQPAQAVVGSHETAKWTATTMEAATTEAQKKVLATGKAVSITGEVVDVSCYLQLGKRGEAHVACGSKCIANGQPVGLLDSEDRLYLLMVEEHHPRRDGQLEIKSVFGPLLSKTVTVNGVEVEMKGYRGLFVQAAGLDSLMKATQGSGK